MCQDALLVIDLQNDFLPGGALAVPGGDRVIDPIRGLMTLPNWRAVVLTQDWHPADHVSFASSHPGRKPFESIALSYGRQTLWPDHCVAGSQGAAFPPDFDTSPARLILRKGMNAALDSYSAFIEADGKTPTGLDGFLKNLNIHRVFVCGLALDYCVKFGVLDALHAGYETIVIPDACAAIAVGQETDILNEMRAKGARTMTASEVAARASYTQFQPSNH